MRIGYMALPYAYTPFMPYCCFLRYLFFFFAFTPCCRYNILREYVLHIIHADVAARADELPYRAYFFYVERHAMLRHAAFICLLIAHTALLIHDDAAMPSAPSDCCRFAAIYADTSAYYFSLMIYAADMLWLLMPPLMLYSTIRHAAITLFYHIRCWYVSPWFRCSIFSMLLVTFRLLLASSPPRFHITPYVRHASAMLLLIIADDSVLLMLPLLIFAWCCHYCWWCRH